MKNVLKSVSLTALVAVAFLGLASVTAQPVAAIESCSIYKCYGFSGWTRDGSCVDWSNPHCPLYCEQYRNDFDTTKTCYTNCEINI